MTYGEAKPEIYVQMGHAGSVNSVCFSPDRKYIASGSVDKTIKLWEASTGKLVRTFVGHESQVNSVCFSPDGNYIASGSGKWEIFSGSYDNTIKLWEVSTGKLVRTFEGHKLGVNAVCFSPDGKYIASGSESVLGSSDNTIKLWEVSTGELVRTFEGYTGGVESVCFSPDGKYIAS
ncbi:MAG TPA: WD40 repeat domain-containing protein, partial [Candidatus Hydrothermia bacterium]|nr:WD40 repeat domain-containing protein [Candidatus Hydrothermia bacterium]